MIITVKRLCIVIACILLAPFQVAADEVTDVVNDVAAKLVQQLPMDKKIALKSLSPEESGLPEEYLRRLVNEIEAALLTESNFKIVLQNRYATEEIWAEAMEFGDAKFKDIYEASKADFLILISPRAAANDVEINIQAAELNGDAAGRIVWSSGYFNLGVNLEKFIGVNYDFLAEQVQIEINNKLRKIEQQISLINYIRDSGGRDASIDKRLVKLIQDKNAFVMDVNRAYKAKIKIADSPTISLSEAAFTPLTVPYFSSHIGQTFFDSLPSSAQLSEGFLMLSPGVERDGKFRLKMDFSQTPRNILMSNVSIELTSIEVQELAEAIEKMNNWESLARERNINRGFAKSGYCMPNIDACHVSFDFLIFESQDKAEFGRLINFQKGSASYSYSFTAADFNILLSYLIFMRRDGIDEFMKQMTDDGGLVTMFSD